MHAAQQTFQRCDVDSHVVAWLKLALGDHKSKAKQQIDDMLILNLTLGHRLLP